MSRKRAHISLETLLASELLRRTDADGKPWIPLEHAKLMTAYQVISLFQRQHNILHAHGGPDTHWNVDLMPIMQHRHVTATVDVPRFHKGNRLATSLAEHHEIMRTKEPGTSSSPRGSIPSRPFPEGHRPLRSGNSFQRSRV